MKVFFVEERLALSQEEQVFCLASYYIPFTPL
jgi:hypothetical protein